MMIMIGVCKLFSMNYAVLVRELPIYLGRWWIARICME